MPLFSRRPVAQPAGYHAGPSPMTRLKRMFTPRRTRYAHTHHTHTTAGGAAANPAAAVEREGRRAKRFFTRRAHGATGVTAGTPRRRRGLFSSRRRHHGAGVAVPVGGAGGAYPHRRSPLSSLTALFSKNRAPRHHQAGGVGAGGRTHVVV